MDKEELSNWWALCNALKFINHTSKMRNVIVDEKDLDYREILNYISSVSGDIATCMSIRNGVPYKYSLCTDNNESFDLDDLDYDFLGE
jgi:hypothetical protein